MLLSRGMGTYIGWPVCGQSTVAPSAPTNPGLSGLVPYGWPRRGLTGTVPYGWPRRGLTGIRGLGCPGCGGTCGGCNNPGLGYFDTGWDISGWGMAEWGTVLLFGYVVMSTVFTTQRGYKKARRSYRRARQRMSA